nr:hypothetical protein [uncultured Cohaesibacter sp.]
MKTFILLLGAQKCGTSWLHEYLKQSPRFGQGFSKEYHIWDALDIGILHGNRVDPVTLDTLASDQKVKQSQRFRMQNEEGYYFDYFTSLFTEDVTITADITPSYSGLKAERLRSIKQKFAERGGGQTGSSDQGSFETDQEFGSLQPGPPALQGWDC